MEKYVVNGGKRLSGVVQVERAKNSVLPILAGALLTEEQVVIKKCPQIYDVVNMIEILRTLGVRVEFEGENVVIDASGLNQYEVKSEKVKELRSSVYLFGALLGKLKHAKMTYPGGCNIGLRPIDLHLKAFRELGVKIVEEGEFLNCEVDKTNGKEIYLDFPSVGATENIILLTVLSDGKTEIHNSAKEPEIVDLMNFLNSMGAKIYGAGTDIILIDGVKKLHGTEFLPMGDRIEAGTYLLAGAITGGDVEIHGVKSKNISSLVHKLCDNTCKVNMKNDIIYLKSGGRKKPFCLETGPFPFFPTDLQAQTMSLLAVCDGVSVVTENVFEMRFNHVPELIKMGADITVKGRSAFISGVKSLRGANVCAKDLRAGASLILAGLVAEGETIISNAYHIDRGYLHLDKKLTLLGADVKKL